MSSTSHWPGFRAEAGAQTNAAFWSARARADTHPPTQTDRQTDRAAPRREPTTGKKDEAASSGKLAASPSPPPGRPLRRKFAKRRKDSHKKCPLANFRRLRRESGWDEEGGGGRH